MNFALAHVLGSTLQTALLNASLVVIVGWGLDKNMVRRRMTHSQRQLNLSEPQLSHLPDRPTDPCHHCGRQLLARLGVELPRRCIVHHCLLCGFLIDALTSSSTDPSQIIAVTAFYYPNEATTSLETAVTSGLSNVTGNTLGLATTLADVQI